MLLLSPKNCWALLSMRPLLVSAWREMPMIGRETFCAKSAAPATSNSRVKSPILQLKSLLLWHEKLRIRKGSDETETRCKREEKENFNPSHHPKNFMALSRLN